MPAGRGIGTIFVELDLDATKYTKRQKDILAGAKQNSADIEKSFKRVGIMSDKMYDAMRKNITNSLEAIKRSHLTTDAEKVRAAQSVAMKIKAINDEQYSHQKHLAAQSNRMSRDMQSSWLGIMKGMIAYRLILSGITAIQEAFFGTFRYLATIETATLGIGAAFMTSGKYIDATTGKALKGMDALNAARMDSKDIIDELKAANLQTIATLDQLIVAYQQALPVAMAKGFDKSQVKAFTLAMVQAAGAIGLSMDQLGEETRSVLTGAINPRTSRIATVLGLRNEDIRQFKNDSQGLFDFLMDKLKAYQVAGVEAQNTWAGLWSNMKDIMYQYLGEGMTPLFDAIKDSLMEITNSMITVDEQTNKITWNPEFLESVKTLQNAITTIVTDMRRLAMLIDLAGAGMARFAYVATLGLSKTMKDAIAIYDERFKKNERVLMDMAMREEGYKRATKETPGAIPQDLFITPETLWYVKETSKAANYLANDTKKVTEEAKKLAEQWEKTKRRLEGDIDSEGLSDLERKLISNKVRAEELIERFKSIPGAVDKITAWQKSKDADAEGKQAEKDLDKRLKAEAKAAKEYERIVTEANSWAISERERAINTILAKEHANVTALGKMWAEERISREKLSAGITAIYEATDEAIYRQQQKKLVDAVKFYSQIEGFEKERHEMVMKLIDMEKAEWIKLYGAVAAEARAKQARIDEQFASLNMAEKYGRVTDAIRIMTSGFGDHLAQLGGARNYIVAYKDMWLDAFRTMEDYSAAYVDAIHNGFNSMGDAITDFAVTGKAAFSDFARSVLADMIRIATQQAIIAPLMQMVMPSYVPAAAGFLSGHRASGGPVSAGSSYIVGEKGPELFVPKNSGTIVPGGGSAPKSVTVNIRNESGQKMEAKQGRATFDAQGMVLDIVIDGINRNVRGMRDMLGR